MGKGWRGGHKTPPRHKVTCLSGVTQRTCQLDARLVSRAQGGRPVLTDGGGFVDYRAQLDQDLVSFPASRSLLNRGYYLKHIHSCFVHQIPRIKMNMGSC